MFVGVCWLSGYGQGTVYESMRVFEEERHDGLMRRDLLTVWEW